MVIRTGTNASETITGTPVADIIKGLGGRDIIDGRGGSDFASYAEKTTALIIALNGATNSVVTVGGRLEDTIRNIENIIGGTAADTITGDRFANTFRGGLGNDILDGGAGIDTLDYTDKTASVNLTLSGSTTATVRVGGVNEDSVKNFENVRGGQGADTITGDNDANKIRGGGGDDILDGRGGSDTLDYTDKTASVRLTLADFEVATVRVGGISEDTVKNFEIVLGGQGADTITGDISDNTIRGGGGNDILDGFSSILTGSKEGGDTVDYSDKTAGLLIELNGAVATAVLVGGVREDTIVNFDHVIGGSGNDTIIGDSGFNKLRGGAGRDFLDGGGDRDIADYSNYTGDLFIQLDGSNQTVAKVDNVVEDTLVNIESLRGGAGNDTLIGDALGNRLNGGAGNDRLKAGFGFDPQNPDGFNAFDILDGGYGIDTADFSDFSVDISVRANSEAETGTIFIGDDVISGDRILGSYLNIENLITGTGNDTLKGDSADNRLEGNSGRDTLNGLGGLDTLLGGAGSDTLNGGLGNDALTGGTSRDVFIFNTKLSATNIDKITDYNITDDRIHLDDTVFRGLTVAHGLMSVGNFRASAAGVAADADDRIIYETKTGKLFYDKDGTGATARVQFAVLSDKPVIDHLDFLII